MHILTSLFSGGNSAQAHENDHSASPAERNEVDHSKISQAREQQLIKKVDELAGSIEKANIRLRKNGEDSTKLAADLLREARQKLK